MGENVIVERSMDFAVRIVNLRKYLTKEQYESINKDIQELLGILVSICRTGNANK